MQQDQSPDLSLVFADWVARTGRGDRAAEEAVAAFFRPRVFAMAQRSLQDAAAADEVTQETLWAVVKALRTRTVQSPENLPGFVFGVGRNKIADLRRRTAKRPITQWPADFDPPAAASEAVLDDQRRRLAGDAIRELDPRDREILQMLFQEGIDSAVIGQRLGLTQEAIRQRKSRALKRVSRKLKELLAPVSRGIQRERLNIKEEH